MDWARRAALADREHQRVGGYERERSACPARRVRSSATGRWCDLASAGEFPLQLLQQLCELGLLGLPYPELAGRGGQSYEVYLQVLEELASGWATVAVSASVHVMSCRALATHGTAAQQERWLRGLLAGYT